VEETVAQTLLEVDELRVQYGGVVAVNDISFEIPEGSIVGLIGPNGAGKTTLVDALTGYVRPTRGHVRFAGSDVTGKPSHRLARAGLARTFQSVELFDELTVMENLLVAAETPSMLAAIGGALRPARTELPDGVAWAIEVAEIEDVVDRHPTELSHGQRKLVGVARALASRPKLLLLDEPAAGLDTEETRELGGRLRRVTTAGVTLLLIDHDMGLVLDVCDRVLVIDFGSLIAFGTPAEIRGNAKVVEAYLGTQGGDDGSH
jgi:branched-chain amino acid transport system ATP-binding protein